MRRGSGTAPQVKPKRRLPRGGVITAGFDVAINPDLNEDVEDGKKALFNAAKDEILRGLKAEVEALLDEIRKKDRAFAAGLEEVLSKGDRKHAYQAGVVFPVKGKVITKIREEVCRQITSGNVSATRDVRASAAKEIAKAIVEQVRLLYTPLKVERRGYMAVISEESLPGRRQIQRRLGDLGVNDPSGVAQMVTDPNIFKPDDQLGFASLLVEAEKADQQTREKFVQKWNELGTDQVEWLGHVNDYWRRFGGDSEKTLAVMVSDIHGSDDTMFQRVAMTCPELRGILMWLHFQRAKFLKGKITETQWDAAVDKAKSDVANLTGAQKDAVDNLVVQLTGDLFSKGTRAFARLEEVKTLMDILGEANAGDRLGGGVGMVYVNHEWIVNSFLTNPNRAKALKFFSGWYEGKDGWKFFDELAERFQRPDTHLNKR
jgi:hypothetical protein